LDVTVKPGGNRLEEITDGVEPLATQHRANGEDLLIGKRGEIGERAFLDFGAFAERLAQQVR